MGLGFRFASPLVATRWPKVWPRHAASPSLGQMLTVEEEPLGPKSTNYIGYCWLGGKLQNQLHWLAHTVVEFLGAEVVLRVAWACGTGAGAWKTTGAVWWGANFSGWGRGGSLRSICAEVSTTIFRSLDLFSQEKGVSFDPILREMEKGIDSCAVGVELGMSMVATCEAEKLCRCQMVGGTGTAAFHMHTSCRVSCAFFYGDTWTLQFSKVWLRIPLSFHSGIIGRVRTSTTCFTVYRWRLGGHPIGFSYPAKGFPEIKVFLKHSQNKWNMVWCYGLRSKQKNKKVCLKFLDDRFCMFKTI